MHQNNVNAIINRLLDQADAYIKKSMDNPGCVETEKSLRSLWGTIENLTKDQKDIDIAKEETERIRLQQAIYAIQNNNWRDVQIAQANAQISENYCQQQQAMYIAYENGKNALLQDLIKHCPKAFIQLIELTTVRTNGGNQFISEQRRIL